MMNASANLPARLELIRLELLKEHEEVDQEHLQSLAGTIESDRALKRPIAVESEHLVVLDGAHRLNALKRLQCRVVPVYLVDYHSDLIVVLSWDEKKKPVSKEEVIEAALSGRKLPPKTTKHMIRMDDGSLQHITWIEEEVSFPLDALRDEKTRRPRDSTPDSKVVCGYCNGVFDSKDVDDHLFAVHGVPI